MMNLTQLVLASHNAGKLKELQAMLGESVHLRSIGEFSQVEPEETGLSFVENAILKARNAARISGLPALADDSGLAVDFLGGAPGIYSARYADGKGDAANNAKLLEALSGVPDTDSLEGAYLALQAGLGPLVATLFAVGLLASGLASTSVGAYAGAEIMQGLLHVRVPLIARRLVTLIPALAILAVGFDPTLALILSQVVLSFGIPFALIPLVALTAQQRTLGSFRNRAVTTVAGVAASVFIIVLNALLLYLIFTGA